MSCASALRSVLFLGLLGVGRVPAQPPPPSLAAATTWQAEALLLHHQVPLSDLTSPTAVVAVPVAPVLVVHLWSMECPPCLKELPVLLNVMRGYAREPRVRFLLISESADPARAQAHLARLGGLSPQIISAHGGVRLRSALQDDSQPLTLILDHQRVVRQAFLGSLLGRRSLFTSALDRLLRSSQL